MTSVRLDVWLDVSCLFRTRSEAQRACRNGKVDVLVADFGSVLTSVAVPLAAEHHMLLIDPTGSGANFFTKPTNYLADVSIPSSTVWPVPLANYLVQHGWRRGDPQVVARLADLELSRAGVPARRRRL